MIRGGIYLVDRSGSFTPALLDTDAKNVYLNGYFQREEYFASMRPDLLRQFEPAYEPAPEYTEALGRIRSSNSVALHVRRGDFVQGTGTGFHYVLGVEYYRRAVRTMREEVPDPKFFCFSDDIEWVKANLEDTDGFEFVSLKTPNADVDELMLMKNCSHIVTANSTFSWWAAWLNGNEGAVRIVPDKPYGNSHMIPDAWRRLAAD